MGPVYTIKGPSDTLEIYEDRLTMTPKGIAGLFYKGLKGTKTIPFTAIQAMQFKKSGLLNGYFQFTIAGGVESTGGLIAATFDENSFKFERQNELALQIKGYIEERMSGRTPPKENDIADQIKKLSALRQAGHLSEEEFQTAKQRIIEKT